MITTILLALLLNQMVMFAAIMHSLRNNDPNMTLALEGMISTLNIVSMVFLFYL